MLISTAYRELNAVMHEQRADYGSYGHRWAPIVADLAKKSEAATLLDYGCGKASLQAALAPLLPDIRLISYDPAITGRDEPPAPADFVICTDVLEHVEPELLSGVLDHIRRLTIKRAFLVVDTQPAEKTLPDGRNAHLIQQPYQWWLPQIWARWKLESFRSIGGEFIVTVTS